MLVWKSTVLLSAASLLVWVLRGRSASLRHLIWSLAFAGLLVLPMLSAILPVVRVPVRDSLAVSDVLFKTDAVGALGDGGSARQTNLPAGGAALNWRFLFFAVWAGGAALGWGQILMGWLALERLRSRAAIFAAPIEGVALLESGTGSMPMTYGLWRPSIFLPVEARGWSRERLDIVLQHEMAHVQRCDSALHVLARIALSVYWWNPLAWWAWREFLKEQERAADDLVLRGGACGSDYAGHLLEIAKLMQPVMSGPVLAMASRPPLAGRLEAILDSGRDRRVPRRRAVLAAAVAAAGLVAPLAAMQTKTEVTPGNTGRYTIDVLRFGDAALEKGKLDEAKDHYDRFLSGKPSGLVAVRAYIHAGIVAMLQKDYYAAFSYFEHAQAADTGGLSEALTWQALAKQRLNYMDESNKLFQGAVSAGDAKSPATATTMELYGKFLEYQGKSDEAAKLRQQAAAIWASQTPVSVGASVPLENVQRAGGEVVPPKLLTQVEPEYSPEARAAEYSGTTVLSVVIATDGRARDMRIVRGLGLGLDEKAVAAVGQWIFKPGMKDGQPVNVRATIEVNFRLDEALQR